MVLHHGRNGIRHRKPQSGLFPQNRKAEPKFKIGFGNKEQQRGLDEKVKSTIQKASRKT